MAKTEVRKKTFQDIAPNPKAVLLKTLYTLSRRENKVGEALQNSNRLADGHQQSGDNIGDFR